MCGGLAITAGVVAVFEPLQICQPEVARRIAGGHMWREADRGFGW